MTKQLEKTTEIIDVIKASLDNEDVDVSPFAVFEARMLSTEAVKQKGFHDGARVSRSTLVEMSEYVNQVGTVVPLQVMHETRGMLPVGRVFSAGVVDMPNGETELIGRFYIPEDGADGEQTKLINKIETSLIDEVSVGLLAKKAICSECEFDYFGEDADFFNIMTLTCDNEHTIGENGVHVRLVGMDTFAELSLVGRGAAKDAKILSRAKSSQSLSKETVERLAASGIPAQCHVLTASFKMDNSPTNPTNQGGKSMSGLETILATTSQNLGKVEAQLSQAVDKIEVLKVEVTNLQETGAEKDVEIATLKAAQSTETTELTAANVALEAQLAEASDVVLVDLKAALVATGEKEDDIPADLSTMLSLIKEKGLKLHQLFGAGEAATSDATKTDAEKIVSSRRKSNFKVN